MSVEQYDRVYFIGIGGIGMSALAAWFLNKGKEVAGYDRTENEQVKRLKQKGVQVAFNESPDTVPEAFLDPQNTLVVYTPAVPDDQPLLTYFRDNGFSVRKRASVLGDITRDRFNIAVAGTHGKTTTASVLAHIFNYSGNPCTAFIGGTLQDYEANLLMGQDEDAPIVIEADEYDRSFLQLSPDVAVVTSVEPDHTDIYNDESEFRQGFMDFVERVKQYGLFIRRDSVGSLTERDDLTKVTYGRDSGDVRAVNLRKEQDRMVFDVEADDFTLNGVSIRLPGNHNVENTLAAMLTAYQLGLEPETIKDAVETFKGIKRRFEYRIYSDSIIYIDDYAHHPSAISAVIDAVRSMYPGKKLTVVFQPHLYSRTRDFMNGFAESLGKADRLVLMDIYPAREMPIPGVSSEELLKKVNINNKQLCFGEELVSTLETDDAGVILTLGAGDIDLYCKPLENMLRAKYNLNETD